MSSLHCLAEKACRAGKTVDGVRQPAATTEPGMLCDVCHEAITSAIKQLPKDWQLLRAAIGERAHSDGPKISSTPTAIIPINTRKDALMRTIVEVADQAAAIVSDALHTEQPDGRRKLPLLDNKTAEPGSIAQQTYDDAAPTDEQLLRAAIALVEPNIDLLAAAGPEAVVIWIAPRRCLAHKAAIRIAEQILDMVKTAGATTIDAQRAVRDAYTAAGACDDCNAWGAQGQQRAITERTGIQIALDLADLHHQTRAELGKTRLRHRYAMPCPHCGGRIGRDDGQTIVNCDKCESSWTEREYKFLAGLIVDERKDIAMTNYLLAEAYWRLDQIQRRINAARATGDTLALPGSGAIITDAIADVLQGHLNPHDRAIATDKKTATIRQDTDDTGQWGQHQTPYTPPKPKRKRTRPTKPSNLHIAASSLTTLTDIEDIDTITGPVCTECNMVHAGECA